MNLNARFLLAINKFFRRNGRIVVIAVIALIVLLLLNNMLRDKQNNADNRSSYNPDNPIMDDGGKVPSGEREPVKKAIDDFFNYCNNKDYENAYKYLMNDAKDYYFYNQINNFKGYVDTFFPNKKIYELQNYSNKDGIYIYMIKITDNVELTGATGGYKAKEDKWVVRKSKEGTNEGVDGYCLAPYGYIGKESLSYVAEDENMRVEITSKDVGYSSVGYNVKFTNKTDYFIVLQNGTSYKEITLNVGGEERQLKNTGVSIVLDPDSTTTQPLIFENLYDSGKATSKLRFNLVRLNEKEDTCYTDNGELSNKKYSFNIDLNE